MKWLLSLVLVFGALRADNSERVVLDSHMLTVLDDGSIWSAFDESEVECVKGDLAVVRGTYSKELAFKNPDDEVCCDMEIDGREWKVELVGWIEGTASVEQAISCAVEVNNGEQSMTGYGYLTVLNNGEIASVGGFEPSALRPGQEVVVGRLQKNCICLIDAKSQTILNLGVLLGRLGDKIERTVQEVRPMEYLFTDGYRLQNGVDWDKNLDEVTELLRESGVEFTVKEKTFRYLVCEARMGDDIIRATIDFREQCLMQIERESEGECMRVNAAAGKELLQIFVPEGLVEGDLVSGRPLCIPGVDKELFFIYN